jgi:hypothetical protein
VNLADSDKVQPDPSNGVDSKEMDEFERRSSTMPPIGVDLSGYATEEFARSVGEAINGWLHLFGKILNLKRLKQVVVSYNYNEALAAVDQGAPFSGPLKPTNDEIAVGIAMTPTVLRDGEAMSVMVLNAGYMEVLVAEGTPQNAALHEQMIYTLAHECGHVHDLDVRAASMPDIILKQRLSFRDGILFGIASGCWDEYMACRLSAFIARESALRPLEDTFCTAIERARDRANAAIRQYRMHADVSGVAKEVSEIYKRVLVYAAYMLGHIDGIEGEVAALVPKAMDALDRQPYFKPFFSRLCEELRTMHGTYGQWKGLEVYEPLRQLADELLKVGGIDIQPRVDDGAYVHIPFSAETMPTREEQMAFLEAKNSGDSK